MAAVVASVGGHGPSIRHPGLDPGSILSLPPPFDENGP